MPPLQIPSTSEEADCDPSQRSQHSRRLYILERHQRVPRTEKEKTLTVQIQVCSCEPDFYCVKGLFYRIYPGRQMGIWNFIVDM